MREGQVVRQVMDLLDMLLAGRYCFYSRAVSSPGIGGEGRPRKGQPDITGWITDRQGKCRGLAIECKGERGGPTPEQIENLEWARQAGGIACFAWDVDDVFRAFAEAGVDIPIPYREKCHELENKRSRRALIRACRR